MIIKESQKNNNENENKEKKMGNQENESQTKITDRGTIGWNATNNKPQINTKS